MRLISSFCALACVSALPLAAVAQTAAEPPAPETAPDTAGRTVLDVTASGTLTGLAADALGPDAALTVRLHGPVAFDVDTADFASLEIFADDPAVKLTVSDTAAYDRITAVSIPAAASGEPAAATFTAAAASAGVATLADGDTAPAVTPQNRVISINFAGTRPTTDVNGTTDVTVESTDSTGYVKMAGTAWENATGASSSEVVAVGVYKFDGAASTTETISLAYQSKNTWTVGGTSAESYNVIHRGYLDDGSGVTIDVGNIPFTTYDVYVYSMTDDTSRQFKPIKIRHPTTYGGEDGTSVMYTAGLNNGVAIVTTNNTDYFGTSKAQGIVLNDNVICIAGQEGANLTIETFSSDGSAAVRSCVAAVQIVESFVRSITAAEGAVGLDSLGLSGTATLEDGAVLTVNVQPNRLKVIGPETGTATLKIAADVDFSKIDLSEARNVTIELVSGCTTIPGGEWAVGDVTISTPVTLTVDGADVTPYWSVGGSLTIAEGSSLTVAVAEGVTITKPIQVISAGGTISGTISATAGLKVTKVGNVCWLTGSGTIRPKDELSGSVTWSSIKDSLVDNSGASANLTEASSLVLTFAAGASEGTTLTIDEALTLGSLAVNNQSANPVSIELGTGGSLTVANQVTVAAGGVSLPIGTLFDMTTVGKTSAPSAPADKPAFVVAAGATATLTGGVSGTSYIRKEPITGGGTVVKSEGISRLDLCGVPGAVPNLEDVTLCIEGGGLKLTTGDVAGNNNAVLKSATVVFVGTNPALYMYGWARLGGEVTFVSESDTGYSFNNNDVTSFLSLDNAEATLVLKRGENATEGVALPRVVLTSGVAARVESGHATINLNGTSGSISVNGGKLTLEDPVAEVPVTVASGATVSVPANAGTLALGGISGKGVIEIVPGSTAVSGFGMEAGKFNGTLRIAEGVTKSGDWTIPCNVELNGTAGAGLTVGNGYTLSGTGAVNGTLTFENGATLDASVGALTVGGLVQPDTGTVTVKVAENAAVEDAVLRLSSGTADALAAAQFTVAERDTLRVAASGSDYVLAPRMPTDGEASVTVTKPADGSPLNWSDLQWTVGGGTYPSAAAGATNALTLELPEGVTVAVDETITAKSLTVTVVDGNGDGQVTDPATLLLRGDDDLAGIAETLTVTAPAVLQVPCTGTAQQIETMNLAKVRGTGVLEISGVAGATCSAQGLSTEAGVAFGGTLRIAEGVTTSGDWMIPCNVELNGTVSGTLTVPNGKRFGGSGTVTGQLKLENGYILKCGARAEDVPLIGTEVGEGTRVFDTSVQTTGGRLWRDTAKEDFILRLAKRHEHDPAFIADSSGYVVEPFAENDVSGLRLAAAFELDLSDLRDPGKTSGTYAWNVADNWLAPGGGNAVPGADAVVRIMVPAGRNVTVVIPPDFTAAVRAIQVIGMTGEAAGGTTGTLRWVEGNMPSGSEDVPSPTKLTSTLTAQEIRMAGPMEITQECNVSVQGQGAHIGSDAAHCSVWIKAGKFDTNLLLVANTELRVGGGSLEASVSCGFLNLQTQSGGAGLLKIDQNGVFTPSYIHGISKQDRLELAGGTFTVPAGGMELSDQIEVSADSTLHFAGTELAKAILSFAADAPRTGFSGSGTLTLTGTGTLNASNATEGSAYTGHLQFPVGNQVVCNIGQRRPAIGGAPYRIEVVPNTEEANEVRIPLNNADTFVIPPLSDADATAGVAVSGWVGTVAKIDRSKTPADLVLTPLGYPTLDGGAVPGISGEAAMVLRELANSGNRNFTVRQETVTGEPMDFNATGVNAALLLFTNVAKAEDDDSVTVAYAFGISDITVEGDDIIVTAKVLGPKGAATAAYDTDTLVMLQQNNLNVNSERTFSADRSQVHLRLKGAFKELAADSSARFTVKAVPSYANGGEGDFDATASDLPWDEWP